YVIGKFVAKRTHMTKSRKTKVQYLVKWLRYNDHENPWLDNKDLLDEKTC
ncbi:hypothetical protein V8F44DRAFT_490475, partial [Aspergillus fumigatus]